MNYLRVIISLFLLISINVNAQDAHELLRKVNKKFALVKDYSADLRLKTDISFIKMLPVNAKIYYQKPDKMKIKSTGIAILPRQGFDEMFKALSDTASYVPVYQGKDPSDALLDIVNIIPASDTIDLVLGRFWINSKTELIMRSQITSKQNGTIQTEYFYGEQSKYALPDSMVVTVDTKKFKIPKAVAADINNYNSQAKDPGKKEKKGRIFMSMKNYSINKGIPAGIFKD